MSAANGTTTYPVNEYDVEYLRHGDAPFLARIYQPRGEGPFPAILWVHGGAWTASNRLTDEFINRELAASGLLMVSVDFRLAPDHPYPGQIQDVHLATRWLKAHAAEHGGDARVLGGIGASSGAHTLLLSAFRPHDPRYAALPLIEGGALPHTPLKRGSAPTGDASVDYVVAMWPMLDPYVRYKFTQITPSAGEGFGGQTRKLEQTLQYFQDEDTMHEGNPQEVLERGQAEYLPPILILQGTEDMNIPLTLPQRFAPAYRALGGSIQVEWFPGMLHRFATQPGPSTDRALELTRGFIAAQLAGRPIEPWS